MAAQRNMSGAPTEIMVATDEVKGFCEEVKEEVMKKLELNAFEMYEALHYRSQIVAGTNYFVKVQIDSTGKCVHLRMFEPLPCYKDANSNRSVELSSIQENKQKDDELVYF